MDNVQKIKTIYRLQVGLIVTSRVRMFITRLKIVMTSNLCFTPQEYKTIFIN